MREQYCWYQGPFITFSKQIIKTIPRFEITSIPENRSSTTLHRLTSLFTTHAPHKFSHPAWTRPTVLVHVVRIDHITAESATTIKPDLPK